MSVYSHELVEQLEKTKIGLAPGDDGKKGQWRGPHQKGILSENVVSGTFRNEKTDVYTDKTGNKIQVKYEYYSNGTFSVKKTPIK